MLKQAVHIVTTALNLSSRCHAGKWFVKPNKPAVWVWFILYYQAACVAMLQTPGGYLRTALIGVQCSTLPIWRSPLCSEHKLHRNGLRSSNLRRVAWSLSLWGIPRDRRRAVNGSSLQRMHEGMPMNGLQPTFVFCKDCLLGAPCTDSPIIKSKTLSEVTSCPDRIGFYSCGASGQSKCGGIRQ
jgi:hypothetical protein